MASHGATTTSSRLAQLQMRFQQKQMMEREQRRLEMTDDTSEDNTATRTRVGNGRVRQMFDDRRRGVGIDRSNPLKPISRSNELAVVPRQAKAALPPRRRGTGTTNGYARGSGRILRGTSSDTFDTLSTEISSLSLTGDSNNNLNRSMSHTNQYHRTRSSNSIQLKPVVTKKSPAPPKREPRAYAPPPKPQSGAHSKLTTGVKSPAFQRITTFPTAVKRTATNMTNVNQGSRMQMDDEPPAGMGTCNFCKRHFNTERLNKHEEICEKMIRNKRKVFDTVRHRVQGTEAEKYLKKGGTSRPKPIAIKQTQTSQSAFSPPVSSTNTKKSNWRQKHEEFIAAIRAAKQVQAHLARGGKLSDLPPPPPSENPDYIQCPHCNRRFNQAAAERHIPKCATMLHNKPRPSQQQNKKR